MKKTSATRFLAIFTLRYFLFLSLAICLPSRLWAISPEDLNDKLEICEKYFEDGDYDKALQKCGNLIEKMEKGELGYPYIKALFYKAKYLEAMGRYADFVSALDNALKLQKENTANARAYGLGHLEAANLYLEFGDANTAEKYLKEALRLLGKEESVTGISMAEEKDVNTEAQILRAKTLILFMRGQYAEARANMAPLLQLMDLRISTQDYYFELAENSYKTRRINYRQLNRRKRDYAEILTLRAENERAFGDYGQAKLLVFEAAGWIKREMSLRDQANIRNRHEIILIGLDKGANFKKEQKALRKIMFLAERRLTPVHKDFIEIHETVIDYFIESRFARRNKIERWDYRNNAGKFYGKDKPQHAAALRLDAKKAFYAKNYKQAKSILEDLLNDTLKVPLNHVERLALAKQLYEVEIASDNYKDAEKAVAMYGKTAALLFGEESLEFQFSLMMLADYYLSYTDKFGEAEKILQGSFNENIKDRLHPHHKDIPRFLGYFADFHTLFGRYTEAEFFLKQALAGAKEKYTEDHIQYVIQLEKYAKLQMKLGNFALADSGVTEILSVFDGDYHRRHAKDYAKALETAAYYYAAVGRYEDAQDALLKAGRFNKKSLESIANSSAIDELGELYIRMEEYADLNAILKKAIAVRTERYGPESRFLISPYIQNAKLKVVEEEFLEAEQFAHSAYEIASKTFGDSSVQIIECKLLNAELYENIGDYEKALEELNEALALQKKFFGDSYIGLANTYSKLAFAKYHKNEPTDGIIGDLEISRRITAANLGEDNPAYAVSLRTLAIVNMAAKNHKNAEYLLNQANNIWIKTFETDKTGKSANIYALLGDVKYQSDEWEAALGFYAKAHKRYARRFGRTHQLTIDVLAQKSRAQMMGGKLKKSEKTLESVLENHLEKVSKFFPAFSEAQKNIYWDKMKVDFEFYTSMIAGQGEKIDKKSGKLYNNIIKTKALLLSNSIKVHNTILRSHNDSLTALYYEWVAQKELLSHTLAMSNEQRNDENLEPKKIERRIESLEKDLNLMSEEFKEGGRAGKDDWKDIRNSLKKGEACVEITRFRHFNKIFTDSVVYMALVIDRDTKKAPKAVAIKNGKNLETRNLAYFRNAIKFQIEDNISHDQFWKPIEAALGSNKKIYVSSDGVYNQINLEAILRPDGSYVIDSFDIMTVSRTVDMLESRRWANMAINRQKEKKVDPLYVMIGNPDFYEGNTKGGVMRYSPLPGTQKEVEIISQLIRDQQKGEAMLLSGIYATEENVKHFHQVPRVLHFATHGFFLEDKAHSDGITLEGFDKSATNELRRSGLLLKNAGNLLETDNVFEFNKEGGVLTAYEAKDLNLESTELVVLSACETGRGNVSAGEGVYGLQRSFLVAGAKGVIMSLFKVSDTATEELMVLFYQNWLSGGDKRQAFSDAKKTLRESYPEPIYWGAFVMISNE